MTGLSWTPEQDNLLRSLARSGLGVTAIAERMGRRKAAIMNRAKTLEIAVAKDRKLRNMKRGPAQAES